MLSFWERNSLLEYDYILIGGGLNGLSAAAAIKEKRPKASVLIVERGTWPIGASTRNAGFACYGSFAELRSDIQKNGIDQTLVLTELRKKGMELHRKRLGDAAMGYVHNGGAELIFKEEAYDKDELQEMNRLLSPVFGEGVFKDETEIVSEKGFASHWIRAFLFNRTEGQIDTGLMMRNLWLYTAQLGVMMMCGTEVIGLAEQADGCNVEIRHNLLTTRPLLKCKTAIVTTNGFSKKFFPEMDLQPGRGQVLATGPIEGGLKFRENVHFGEGSFYFRPYGNRIIFGGGRSLFEAEETSTETTLNEKIFEILNQYLQDLIIPGTPYTISDRWSGIMAFGSSKMPVIERVSPHVIAGVRMGGMGVALSGITAQILSELLD